MVVVVLLVAATTWLLMQRHVAGRPTAVSPQPSSPARPTGTQVVTVAAVDADGHPINGYRLAPDPQDPGGMTNVSGCHVSPAAVANNIYYCAPNAAGADVCWPSGHRSLLCLDDPWDKGLHRVVDTDPLPNVQPRATPAPFALLLDDGTQCRLRNGGAWGGRDDGLVGAYGCPGESPAVLAPAAPKAGASAIDRSQALWTVKVGSLGSGDAQLPPPKTRTVTTAWFAGNA
jgi:hypothetical protein